MKTSELRIGNYTNKGIIKSFWERGVHIGGGRCYEFSELEPIKLTQAKLEEYGFKAESQYSDFTRGGISISSFITVCETGERKSFFLNLGENNEDLNTRIDYVHELQNIYYALTKEELLCVSNV